MSISDESPLLNLPPDIEAQLNEPPPSQIMEFLREPHRLSDQQVDAYARDGFVKLEQALTGEPLHYYRELIAMAVGYHFKDDSRGLAEKPVYEQSVLQAHNLGLRYPACARLFGRSELLPSPVISCGRKAFGGTSIRRYTNNRGVASRIFTRMVDTGPLSLPASTTTDARGNDYMVHYAIYDWPYWNDRIKDFGK